MEIYGELTAAGDFEISFIFKAFTSISILKS